MKQLILLGSNGFVGKNIKNKLIECRYNNIDLNRLQFDITDKNTYQNTNFNNSLIIDCITNIDNNVFSTNFEGLRGFIDYLNDSTKDYSYLYFSTISTLDKSIIRENQYVASKFQAENYIKENIANYKIIRLSYPFGIGEGSNRLISRLIKMIKSDSEVIINDIEITLTPISIFRNDIINLINDNSKEINYIPFHSTKLTYIVDKIFCFLEKKPKFKLNSIATSMELNFNSKNYYEFTHENELKYIDEEIKNLIINV